MRKKVLFEIEEKKNRDTHNLMLKLMITIGENGRNKKIKKQ
mgnify:CR=1 FL=1